MNNAVFGKTIKNLRKRVDMRHISEKKYNSKAQLLFTDTDTLTYEVETKDVYEDFWKDKESLTIVIIRKTANFVKPHIKKL